MNTKTIKLYDKFLKFIELYQNPMVNACMEVSLRLAPVKQPLPLLDQYLQVINHPLSPICRVFPSSRLTINRMCTSFFCNNCCTSSWCIVVILVFCCFQIHMSSFYSFFIERIFNSPSSGDCGFISVNKPFYSHT